MSINPQTYAGVAYGLAEAGARVTYGVAEALTELHQKVIEDPDNLSRAADIYAKHIAEACAKWEKDWRKWADEGLLEAYIQGVKHTDAELANLRKAGIRVHPPTEPIPEGAVMVKKLPTLTLPLDSPKWMKEAFVEIPNHLTAFNVFRRAAYFALEGTALQIIRKGNDLYRDVAIQAGSQMFREADIFTRRQFSQMMLDDFAQRGIQSITYSNGRKMSIEAYSEMVGRTMSGHAAVQGSLNRYAEHGYDLVRVSAHFRACELCVPWEGKVLSTNGMNPDYESLDSAISAGLFHPNCAHSISPYIPGLSPDLEIRVSKEEQALIDKYGYREAQKMAYKAQVQQRHIERQIRFWKKRELTALDPTMKTQAHRKVLDWQAAQRTHLKQNLFLPRKYDRESLGGALTHLMKEKTSLISSIMSSRSFSKFDDTCKKLIQMDLQNSNLSYVEIVRRSADHLELNLEGSETCFYRPGSRYLEMNMNIKDSVEESLRIFWHEYGHYVDDVAAENGLTLTSITSIQGNADYPWQFRGVSSRAAYIHEFDKKTMSDLQKFLDFVDPGKYEVRGESFGAIYLKGTDTQVGAQWGSNRDDFSALMNSIDKKLKEELGEGLSEAYLKSLGKPEKPNYSDYWTCYRTPKRQELKTKPAFKGADKAWYEAMQKYSEALRVWEEDHPNAYVEAARIYKEYEDRKARIAPLADTLDGIAHGEMGMYVLWGGHDPTYFKKGHLNVSEGFANWFQLTLQNDEEMLGYMEKWAPEAKKIFEECFEEMLKQTKGGL